MSTPNPLMPQGAFTKTSKPKSTVLIAVLSIVAVHAVIFGVVLMQSGCKKDEAKIPAEKPNESTNNGFADLSATNLSNSGYQDLVASTSNLPPTSLGISRDWNASNTPPITPLTPTPTSFPEPKPEGQVYLVKRNDNPGLIAKNHHITLEELNKANPGLEPTKMQIGQKIIIPVSAKSTTAVGGIGSVEPTRAVGDTTIYVIKAGDNLTKIANLNHTTPAEIKALNNMKTDRINAGAKIKLPAPKSAATITPSMAPRASSNDLPATPAH